MSTPRQCDEGDGTWVDWVDIDPHRLRALVQEAILNLKPYEGVDAALGTDSEDGTYTAELRANALGRRAAAALRGWQGYHHFHEDFEGVEASSVPIQVVGASLTSLDVPHFHEDFEGVEASSMPVQVVGASLTSLDVPCNSRRLSAAHTLAGQSYGLNLSTFSQTTIHRCLSAVFSGIEEAYLLSMSATCRLTCLGRLYTRCNSQVMQMWLSRYTSRCCTLLEQIPKRLCDEYDAEHLLRLFLKRALSLSKGAYGSGPLRHHFDVVLTGGYAVHKFLSDNFPPGDIDLFVRCRSMVPKLIGLYIEYCILPFHLRLSQTIGGSFDCSIPASGVPEFDRVNQPRDIRRDLQHELNEYLRESPHFSSDVVETLATSVDHLPRICAGRSYSIRGTWRVRATRTGTMRGYIPSALQTLNIILVSCPASVGEPCPSSQRVPRSLYECSFRDFLWRDFDFRHCCVSMTVKNDLHYEYVAAMGAFNALNQKKLFLSSAAFQDSEGNLAIRPQLKRITKYAERGFTW